MSRRSTSIVLGYHGCDERIGKLVTSHADRLQQSEQDYDWLGPGVYFWESDPQRAHEWAVAKASRDSGKKPYVVGAVIDLGNCLDLTLQENLSLLRDAYKDLRVDLGRTKTLMPCNKDRKGVRGGDKLLRYRDCAVIRRLHGLTQQLGIEPFDTVRGLLG